MATYDNALGMWKDKGGGYHSTQSEAIAADQNFIDDSDFFMGSGGIDSSNAPAAQAPAADPNDAPNPNNPDGLSNNEVKRRRLAITTAGRSTGNTNAAGHDVSGGAIYDPDAQQRVFEAGNTGGASGAYNAGSAAGRKQFDYMHELGSPGFVGTPRTLFNSMGERVGVSRAGETFEANPFAGGIVYTPADLARGVVGRATNMGTTADGLGGVPVSRAAGAGGREAAASGEQATTGTQSGTSGPPSFEQGAGRTGIDKETADAKTVAGAVIEQNRDENAQLFADAFSRYDNLNPSDYGLSDEARGYQREGLQQQRMLLEKMLGFDEKQYASQFADQALARSIAAGRSAGGGYASQQAGTFAAMEQAPALYAEGARQASALGNQRLQMAETAAKAFGDLGTMTRGQDEARAQFESNLGLSIADSVARLTEGNVQMNDRDSAQMAEIWMDFAKLQSVYAGMTSDEQLAWWQQETARRGQDQNFEAIKAQLKAQGAVSSKDIIGGLFQLGGGLVSAGGNIGAAYVNRPQNPPSGGGNIVVPNPPAAPAAPAPSGGGGGGGNPYFAPSGNYNPGIYGGMAY